MIEHKNWQRLVTKGTWFHLARIQFMPNRPGNLHTHDFPEVFWIESGQAVHQINKTEEKLFQGDLVFVRASDCHRLQAVNNSGFVLVNLAFPSELLDDLSHRHPEIQSLHANDTSLPSCRRLHLNQVILLKEEVRRLAAGPMNRMVAERFLIGLYLVAQTPHQSIPEALPDWMEKACLAMEKQPNFEQGVPALVQLCGRSPEYVARSFRQHLRTSPTEWVNAVRIAHASRELRLGNRPILEIALESGFGNLAHFYRLFQKTHGITPRRYRIESQRMVI